MCCAGHTQCWQSSQQCQPRRLLPTPASRLALPQQLPPHLPLPLSQQPPLPLPPLPASEGPVLGGGRHRGHCGSWRDPLLQRRLGAGGRRAPNVRQAAPGGRLLGNCPPSGSRGQASRQLCLLCCLSPAARTGPSLDADASSQLLRGSAGWLAGWLPAAPRLGLLAHAPGCPAGAAAFLLVRWHAPVRTLARLSCKPAAPRPATQDSPSAGHCRPATPRSRRALRPATPPSPPPFSQPSCPAPSGATFSTQPGWPRRPTTAPQRAPGWCPRMLRCSTASPWVRASCCARDC